MSNVTGRSPVMIEALESRQFLSATLLGPSAVEGDYKGDVVLNGTTHEVKLVITATTETLTVVGQGTKSITITAKQFKELREGNFSFSGKLDSTSATLLGTVTDKGQRIGGSFSAVSGGKSLAGTYLLKKY